MFGYRLHWKFLLGKSNFPSSNAASTSNASKSHQILCCAYNANGTIFVTGSSDSNARVCVKFLTTVILLRDVETVEVVFGFSLLVSPDCQYFHNLAGLECLKI